MRLLYADVVSKNAVSIIYNKASYNDFGPSTRTNASGPQLSELALQLQFSKMYGHAYTWIVRCQMYAGLIFTNAASYDAIEVLEALSSFDWASSSPIPASKRGERIFLPYPIFRTVHPPNQLCRHFHALASHQNRQHLCLLQHLHPRLHL